MQHIFIHLTQEFIHLLCVSREFVTLLQKEVLNALPIDWPMGEGYFGNRETVFWKVLAYVLCHRAQHWIHWFCGGSVIIIFTFFVLKLQIYVADVSLKKSVQILLMFGLETLNMRLTILDHVLLRLLCILTPQSLLLFLYFQKGIALIRLTHAMDIAGCIWGCLKASSVCNIWGLKLHLLRGLHSSGCIGLKHLFWIPYLIGILCYSILLNIKLVAPFVFSIHFVLKWRDLIHHIMDIAIYLSTSGPIWLFPLYTSYCTLFI